MGHWQLRVACGNMCHSSPYVYCSLSTRKQRTCCINLRPAEVVATTLRLPAVIAPSWARHVLMSYRNLSNRTVDDLSYTSAAEKTARVLWPQASSLAQTFPPR